MQTRLLHSLLAAAALSVACGQTVVEISGDGTQQTTLFTVADGWEIEWTADGELFQILVADAAGELVVVAADQNAPGNGASFIQSGGSFSLSVSALDSWTLRVVQVPPGSVTEVSDALEFEGIGTQITRPFRVSGPWEVHWDVGGELLQVYVFTADGRRIGMAANQVGAGTGSWRTENGGEFYLQLAASGPWRLRVLPAQ